MTPSLKEVHDGWMIDRIYKQIYYFELHYYCQIIFFMQWFENIYSFLLIDIRYLMQETIFIIFL